MHGLMASMFNPIPITLTGGKPKKNKNRRPLIRDGGVIKSYTTETHISTFQNPTNATHIQCDDRSLMPTCCTSYASLLLHETCTTGTYFAEEVYGRKQIYTRRTISGRM